VDLWNDLGFSLCAAPSVCCVVATSDDGERIAILLGDAVKSVEVNTKTQ